ncbi:TnsA-like heteromeric transposase endonuclease subunit [Nonomuraea sp. NPDC026600]|uniref:TnsA-like heteromeric transposase endonuclease subunit n=1 Tax=Nonomuraea sp. NPDC026600 TaxID=3155363 RepID=UPI0033EC6236
MSEDDLVASATIQAKDRNGTEVVHCGASEVLAEQLLPGGPWRTFRWHLGQKHYSGTYWSATERAHVIYESRLELARLLYADFDPGVSRILAQPFLITVRADGATRRHVPDFLLLTEAGLVVVDVKPAHRLSRPEVAFTFEWCRAVMEARGWGYQIWSEPPTAEMSNIRFLAGYRRDWLFDADLLTALGRANLDGATLEEAFGAVAGWDSRLVRAAVFHLLWSGRLVTELERPLSGGHVVRCAR